MKLVILDGYTENPGDLSWDALAALGDLTVYDYTAPEEILPRIGDAPIILTNKTPITRQTMDECPNLRYIGVLATGFNVIDIAAAKEKGMNVWCYFHSSSKIRLRLRLKLRQEPEVPAPPTLTQTHAAALARPRFARTLRASFCGFAARE